MVKILYTSNLYIDDSNKMIKNCKINPAEILILSGNVSNGEITHLNNFMKWCSFNFEHVIYVPGDYEHDNCAIKSITQVCNNYENIYFLQNDILIIKDIFIIGSTLWDKSDSHQKNHINSSNRIHELLNCLDDNDKIILVTYYPPTFIYDLHTKSINFWIHSCDILGKTHITGKWNILSNPLNSPQYVNKYIFI